MCWNSLLLFISLFAMTLPSGNLKNSELFARETVQLCISYFYFTVASLKLGVILCCLRDVGISRPGPCVTESPLYYDEKWS